MKEALTLALVAAVIGAAALIARRLGLSASSFNPASSDNLAYKGANSVMVYLTGDQNQTVGGGAYDLANPRAGLAANEYSPSNGIIVTVPRQLAADATEAQDDADYGAFLRSLVFGATDAGAVTGRAAPRGF